MDKLDIYAGRLMRTHAGKYYDKTPDTAGIVPQPFDYEVVDMASYRYKQLFGNLMDNTTCTAAIRTNDPRAYKVGGFVLDDRGRLFTVVSVTEDTASVESEQVFRYFPVAAGTDYILRLVEKENPWGLK